MNFTLIFERLPLLQHDLLIDIDENIIEVLEFVRLEFAGETREVIGDRVPCSCQERAGMLDTLVAIWGVSQEYLYSYPS